MDYFIDFNSGDPMPRDWFLLKSSWEPLTLCLIYVAICKYIGPWLMKNRKPFELRTAMVAYNGALVSTYAILLLFTMYYVRQIDWNVMCKGTLLREDTVEYKLVNVGYALYMMKYAEFLDTVFFVLRKKFRLLTTLHVTHHALMPILGFVLFRTERSGAQAFPVLVNSLVHIVMYTYYFLAALGPRYAKYLWWKRYLTLLQMTQFVIIISFAVIIVPLTGCRTEKTSLAVDIGAAGFFFALFYNFYQHCFIKKKEVKPVRVSEKEG